MACNWNQNRTIFELIYLLKLHRVKFVLKKKSQPFTTKSEFTVNQLNAAFLFSLVCLFGIVFLMLSNCIKNVDTLTLWSEKNCALVFIAPHLKSRPIFIFQKKKKKKKTDQISSTQSAKVTFDPKKPSLYGFLHWIIPFIGLSWSLFTKC